MHALLIFNKLLVLVVETSRLEVSRMVSYPLIVLSFAGIEREACVPYLTASVGTYRFLPEEIEHSRIRFALLVSFY